ncbi:hypothetical protein R6Q57_012814 [Mikania cordata]
MEVMMGAVLVVLLVLVAYGWRFFNWVWLQPKAMEKSLREQGLTGNRYRFFYGDLKEMVQMANQAKCKPIKLTDSIVPRVIPFNYSSAKTYCGNIFFTWLGPQPIVHVTDPPMIRQILANYNQFQKLRGNPLSKMLAKGVASDDADQWVKHRKIINPAFHVEKLKHMLPAFHISCNEMIHKWERKTKGSSCEVDVYPYLQTMASDVISRTAFGSSYEEGRKIFELQLEQAKLVLKAAQSMYIPGSRLYPPIAALGRMIHEETKIENLILPSGSHLMLHLMLLHYDANLWGDDANEFNPERFDEGVSKATKGQAIYFPFGGGPRICVGQAFAMLEAKLALVMILRRFSFKLSPSYSHAPHTIITLQPQFGAQLILSEL